jgi:large subunit ribosomal protein L22
MARDAHELATGTKAKASFIWISPTKIRQVAALINGKPVDEARRILAFSPKVASRHIAKVLESAIANAEHNHHIPQDELLVKRVWADGGPTFKRVSPRARRSAYLIRKRTSHINVEVERTEEALDEEPAAPRPRRQRRVRTPKAAPEATTDEAAVEGLPEEAGSGTLTTQDELALRDDQDTESEPLPGGGPESDAVSDESNEREEG